MDTVRTTPPSPEERKVGSLSAGDISPPRLLLSGAEAESETERAKEREKERFVQKVL